jgi:AcrR family transcriptional regulator
MPTAKGAATRGRIVDATVDVLVRGGREAVNLDDILASTRTSKGQLFHYFPGGKQELIRAATARQVERLSGELTGPLETWPAWEAWVDMMVRLHREQTAADACEVVAIAGRMLGPDREERSLLGAAIDAWRDQVAAGISAMRASGLLRPDADPQALAVLVVTAVQGGAVADKATASTDYLERALRATLGYLRTFAAPPP